MSWEAYADMLLDDPHSEIEAVWLGSLQGIPWASKRAEGALHLELPREALIKLGQGDHTWLRARGVDDDDPDSPHWFDRQRKDRLSHYIMAGNTTDHRLMHFRSTSSKNSIIVARSLKMIIIARTSPGSEPRTAMVAVGRITDYLMSVGF